MRGTKRCNSRYRTCVFGGKTVKTGQHNFKSTNEYRWWALLSHVVSLSSYTCKVCWMFLCQANVLDLLVQVTGMMSMYFCINFPYSYMIISWVFAPWMQQYMSHRELMSCLGGYKWVCFSCAFMMWIWNICTWNLNPVYQYNNVWLIPRNIYFTEFNLTGLVIPLFIIS